MINDGKTIVLWLQDFSLGRQGEKRKFKLAFLTDNAAASFFDEYTKYLVKRKRHLSYEQMVEGGGDGDSSSDSGSDGGADGGSDGGSDGGAEAENKEGEDNHEGDKKEDEDQHKLLELDEPFGDSQCLFNPTYPGDQFYYGDD